MTLDLGELPLLGQPLSIREWRSSDLAALVRHANNEKVAAQLRDRFPHPYTLRDGEKWLASTTAVEPPSNFAITAGDEAIGGIGLELQKDVYCRAAELGYWLGEPYWNQGVATRAVTAFTSYAFDRFDLIRIFAMVFETNPASARVLEKAGYRFEGRLRMSVVKHGRVLDQLLYSKLRSVSAPDRPG